MERRGRAVHLPGIGARWLGISLRRKRTLELAHVAKLLSSRGGALLRRHGPCASAWPSVRMEALMVGTRSPADAAVLHLMDRVAARLGVRMRRWRARRLETQMGRDHGRKTPVLLPSARSGALATKVGHPRHRAQLLLLSRVEHHLLERPLRKLLLLLLVGRLRKVALLVRLLLVVGVVVLVRRIRKLGLRLVRKRLLLHHRWRRRGGLPGRLGEGRRLHRSERRGHCDSQRGTPPKHTTHCTRHWKYDKRQLNNKYGTKNCVSGRRASPGRVQRRVGCRRDICPCQTRTNTGPSLINRCNRRHPLSVLNRIILISALDSFLHLHYSIYTIVLSLLLVCPIRPSLAYEARFEFLLV